MVQNEENKETLDKFNEDGEFQSLENFN